VRRASAGLADGRRALRREVLGLVALVLVVDGAFIALYYLLGLAAAGGTARLAYTVLWTVLTLVVVLRALARIRAARLRLRRMGE
jgi:hypothetical protein